MRKNGAMTTGREKSKAELLRENADLQAQLKEVQEAFRAMKNGEVDALLLDDQVFTIQGAETPYRILVESINEGAATLSADGVILYCNRQFSTLIGVAIHSLIGSKLCQFIQTREQGALGEALAGGAKRISRGEFTLRTDPRGRKSCIQFTFSPFHIDGVQGTCVVATDLAERKLAEDARMSSTLSSIGDAVLATDLDKRITFLNQAGETLTGWPLEECISKPVEEVLRIVNELTRVPVVNPIDEVLRTGQAALPSNHASLIRRDGTEIPIIDSAAPIYDQRGKSIGVVMVFRDITEWRRNQQVLRESEERFRIAVMNSSLAFAQFDRDLRLTWIYNAHPDFASSMGKRSDEVRDCEGKRRMTAIRRQVLETGNGIREEISYDFSDGIHVYDTITEPIFNSEGAVIGGATASLEITERKRAEEEAAQTHRQIQSIIDNTPAIVYAFDMEERFLIVNAALAKVLNSTPEQMIGRRRHEFMPREDADWHESNDRQVAETGRALEFEEYSQINGHSITWLTTKFPLRDAEGRIYAVAGISSDITERKKAQDLLKASELNMRLMVNMASDAMMVVNTNGIIEAVSALGMRLLGYREEDLIGKCVAEFAETISRLDAVLTIEELRKRAPAPLRLTARVRTKNGDPVWLSVTASFISLGTQSERYFVKFERVNLPTEKIG